MGRTAVVAYFKLLVRTVSKTVRMVDFTSHFPTMYPVNKPALCYQNEMHYS